MKNTVMGFIQKFKEKKIANNRLNEHAVSEYLKKELEIKTYIPFRTKRQIVEMVVSQNTDWVDSIKKHDSINAYIGFVVAMISAHTSLQFSDDPVADYDLLAESGLLPQIIAEFKESYDECDILLKMALAMELEDNNINVLFGKFLNSILQRVDSIVELAKNTFGNIDIKDVLGKVFKEEDLAELKGFLDKYNK